MTEQPESTDQQIGADASVDTTGAAGEKESYHGYSVDDEDQPQGFGDSLADDRGLAEPLDEGYSPPEKWSPAQGYGNTPLEEEMGESLTQRERQEVEEPDPYQEAAAIPVEQLEGAPGEEAGLVGDDRAGRLIEPDEGVRTDDEAAAVADDVGVDGAGASAEEAAVHVVED